MELWGETKEKGKHCGVGTVNLGDKNGLGESQRSSSALISVVLNLRKDWTGPLGITWSILLPQG